MSGKGAVASPTFVPLSPQVAFREVVRTYGVKEMAAQLLMTEGVLQNKCHTDEDSHHKPTMADVVNVTRVSGDTRILESLDRMFGRAGYEIVPGPVDDSALMELLCRIGTEKGAMYAALQKGLHDKRFCLDDYRAVKGEAYDVISAVLDFIQRLEGLVDA